MKKEKLGSDLAFPTEVGYENREMAKFLQTGNGQAHFSGISKRFYAACAAMQGLLAHPYSEGTMEQLVEYAYKYADEILKQENL